MRINEILKSDIAKIISSIIALIISLFFIFLPALRQHSKISSEIKTKKTSLDFTQLQLEQIKSLESQIDKLKEQISVIRENLFWDKDLSKFLNKLTQLASDLPIEFVSLKPEPISKIEKNEGQEKKSVFQEKDSSRRYSLIYVPISINLRTDYNYLIKFLTRIEQADKFIKINELSIESDSRDIFRHNIRMNLSIFIK